jgi:hypothetical protein
LERSKRRKITWQFVGDCIITFLWLSVLTLAEFDFWVVVLKGTGIL